jgi:uncharacterized membrane protein
MENMGNMETVFVIMFGIMFNIFIAYFVKHVILENSPKIVKILLLIPPIAILTGIIWSGYIIGFMLVDMVKKILE